MEKSWIVTVGALVLDKDENILLKKDPVRGWALPGGMIEPLESVKDAIYREVLEETGINIKVERILGVSQEKSKEFVHIWWLARSAGGNLRLSSESMDVGFFEIDEVLEKINNKLFQVELKECLKQKEEAFFLEFE